MWGKKNNDNRNQNAVHIFPDDGLIAIIRSVCDLTASLDYNVSCQFMQFHRHTYFTEIEAAFKPYSYQKRKKTHFDYHFAMAYKHFYHSQNTNIFILMAAFFISRFRFILSLVITAVCVRRYARLFDR